LQGTRSFELRAALALAKLYRATGRDAEAHAVLWRPVEGFAPTTEVPEIAEAQEMIAAIEAGPRLCTGLDNALSNGRNPLD
jgi:hypothetical protein